MESGQKKKDSQKKREEREKCMAEYEITVDKAKELLTKECKDMLKFPGLIETLHVLAHETCRLGNELEEKVLGEYSYYEGQLNGLEIALYLINRLPKAEKRPSLLSHDEIEYDTKPKVLKYFCTACGQDEIEEEDRFCKNCGAYFQEAVNE